MSCYVFEKYFELFFIILFYFKNKIEKILFELFKLLSGTSEVMGTEMVCGQQYLFRSNISAAVSTFEGCQIKVPPLSSKLHSNIDNIACFFRSQADLNLHTFHKTQIFTSMRIYMLHSSSCEPAIH